MASDAFISWLNTQGYGFNQYRNFNDDRRTRIRNEWEQYWQNQPAPAPAPSPAPAPDPVAPVVNNYYTTAQRQNSVPLEREQGPMSQTVYNYPTAGQEWTQTGTPEGTTTPWGATGSSGYTGGSGAPYTAPSSGSQHDWSGWQQGSWGGGSTTPVAQATQSIWGTGTGSQATAGTLPSSTEGHPFFDPNSSYPGAANSNFLQANPRALDIYAQQNPAAYYYWWLGQQGLGGFDARSTMAQDMYRDAMAGYEAARINNFELQLPEYLRGVDFKSLMNQMTYDQLGINSDDYRNRWGMRAT